MSLNDVSGIIAVISIVLGVIGVYWKVRTWQKDVISMLPSIIDYAEQRILADAEKWVNSEAGQKALYQIGGLVGSGARAGIGLSRGKGKTGLQDIIINLIAGRLGVPQLQPEQPQNSNSEQL